MCEGRVFSHLTVIGHVQGRTRDQAGRFASTRRPLSSVRMEIPGLGDRGVLEVYYLVWTCELYGIFAKSIE